MFVKILKKKYSEKTHYYASLVENKRLGKSVVQSVIINFGRVELEQIPYLKAAYSKNKPRLVYNEEEEER